MVKQKAEAIGTGMKRGGKVEWDDAAAFTQELKAMEDGPVAITVERVTERGLRAYKAHRYYWGLVLPMIAKESGQGRDEVHEEMTAKFLTRHAAIVNKLTGEAEDFLVQARFSKLKPSARGEYIDEVRKWAGEFFGLDIPDPDPSWREKRDTQEAA